MKIEIKKFEGALKMLALDGGSTRLEIEGECVLSEVYCGVGIRTDKGHFGIAQRDGGIEVMLDGKTVWTSHEIDRQAVKNPVRCRVHVGSNNFWYCRSAGCGARGFVDGDRVFDRRGRSARTSEFPDEHVAHVENEVCPFDRTEDGR